MTDRPNLQGKRILIVEDHADSAEAMRVILESFGAAALVARNGTEAVAVAMESLPSLIMCDLRLPGMDGYTLLRRLRASPLFATVPVMAVTGMAAEDDLERTRAAGFEAHIVKPVDYAALALALARWAGKSH